MHNNSKQGAQYKEKEAALIGQPLVNVSVTSLFC
jgi:hypothetical protein